MKKIAQFVIMSLMLAAVFTSINAPAIAGVNGPIGATPAPMPMCPPDDPTCDRGPIWPRVDAKATPAPMPMCAPDDDKCDRGPLWPR